MRRKLLQITHYYRYCLCQTWRCLSVVVPSCGGAWLWWCLVVVVPGCDGACLWWCLAVVVPVYGGACLWWCLSVPQGNSKLILRPQQDFLPDLAVPQEKAQGSYVPNRDFLPGLLVPVCGAVPDPDAMQVPPYGPAPDTPPFESNQTSFVPDPDLMPSRLRHMDQRLTLPLLSRIKSHLVVPDPDAMPAPPYGAAPDAPPPFPTMLILSQQRPAARGTSRVAAANSFRVG
ncbi:unnamed protein product [Closterium sp. NIES-64]|nr:unnamed protein product [Closterium sp. NIES-64]